MIKAYTLLFQERVEFSGLKEGRAQNVIVLGDKFLEKPKYPEMPRTYAR